MEQKRTLWIVLASGIFLLVVIGAALILYSPSSSPRATARSLADSGAVWTAPSSPLESRTQGTAGTSMPPLTPPGPANSSSVTQSLESPREGTSDVVDILPFDDGQASRTGAPADIPAQNSQGVYSQSASAPQITQTDSLTVIANGATNIVSTGTTIDLNALKEYSPSVTPANQKAENAMKETGKAPAKSTPQQTQAKTSTPAPATKTPAASGTANVKKTTAPKGSTSAVPAAKPLPDRFWVQVASYASKKNADEARAVLDEHKIPCEVFTYKDSSGKIFYRVRAGDYTTKSEAEYWQSRIAEIPEFAKSKSYITNSSAKAK